jgi:hypothetical protein
MAIVGESKVSRVLTTVTTCLGDDHGSAGEESGMVRLGTAITQAMKIRSVYHVEPVISTTGIEYRAL